MRPLGWAGLVVAAGSVVASLVLGWAELAAVGIVLTVALAAGGVQAVGRSTYRVDLRLPVVRLKVGERAVAEVVVHNEGRRSLLPSYFTVPVGRRNVNYFVPILRPEASHDEILSIPTQRRGVISLGPVTSVRGDGLGLVRREVQWTKSTDIFVHPEVVRLTPAGSGLLRDLEGQSLQIISDSDISFHALREYVPGDDRRHVHWKTTARVGELMVRQFDDTRRTRTALLLSAHEADYLDRNEFELAVSVYASLGVQSLIEEREVVAFAGSDTLRTGSRPYFLDDCSRLDLAAEHRPYQQLPAWVGAKIPDASIAMFVVGSIPTARELRAKLSLLDKGMSVFIFQCQRGTPPQVRELDDATVLSVGSLEQLVKLMRRVSM